MAGTAPSQDNYNHMLLTFLLDSVAQGSGTLWELRYPVTGKQVTERDMLTLIKKLNKEFEDIQSQITDQFPDQLMNSDITDPEDLRVQNNLAHIPMYEPVQYGDEQRDKEAKLRSRVKFQNEVRRFIRGSKPAQQLAILNAIQKNTKFSIFNPMQKKRVDNTAFDKLRYGYADLLRFLCEPTKSGITEKLTKANPLGNRFVLDNSVMDSDAYTYNGKNYVRYDPNIHMGMNRYRKELVTNPFYQPILYDVPDDNANERLENLYIGARKYYKKKMEELTYLHKELANADSNQRKRNIIENILLIYRQIYDNRFDPIHLSKQIKGQERPMEKYRQDHFIETLQQLVTRSKIAPGARGIKPPAVTGVHIGGPGALNQKLLQTTISSSHAPQTKRSRRVRKTRKVKKVKTPEPEEE